ncbi:MAG: competence/damage-inducible protein A [Legionellales bacterium]|nr:competence/damage-inducible protein A [Legionellales bacterium]
MQKSTAIALLTTGDEIIQGDIQNTNAQNLANRLFELGFTVGNQLSVSDDEKDIINGLQFLAQSHQAIIITGGLGPTADDRTRYALARFLNRDLQLHEPSMQQLRERFARYQVVLTDNNQQQALFPGDAVIFPNANGSAPGCMAKHAGQLFFMLPGPPRECLPMFEEFVLPMLNQQLLKRSQDCLKWQVLGISESLLAQGFEECVKPFACRTGYRVHYPYVEVKLYLDNQHDRSHIQEITQQFFNQYAYFPEQKTASDCLLEYLIEHQCSLSLRDLATKGLLAQRLLNVRSHHLLEFYAPNTAGHHIIITGLETYWDQSIREGNLEFTVEHFFKNTPLNHTQHHIPYRQQPILLYVVELICQQVLDNFRVACEN